MTVVITDDAVAPEVSASPSELDPPLEDGHPAPTSYIWQPARSLTGPVSIVVSGKDKRLVVLRNGIEIGSANVVIDGPVQTTEAFTLEAISGGEVHWLRHSLPGRRASALPEMTGDERARAHLPEGLRDRILDILRPGSTLLITRDSLRSSGSGRALTVIETDAP